MNSANVLPSDTQVVSQSVYDSIIQRNGESMYDVSQNGADGATLMTLHEGDSGHIDLLAEFDSAHHKTDLSPEQDEESNYDPSESSPLAYQPEFFPESQRFLTTTPGTAVKKIQTPRTSTETPSLSRNPLAAEIESSGGLMGLSQLFKATQAPSSPIVHGQQPELVSDRPSPNIPIQHSRVAHHHMTSPLVNFARESSEPNLNYISMKESQSRRDTSLGERLTRSADNMHSDDPLDQEFNKESSFVENARRQRLLDQETAAQFARLNAPARSDNRALSPEYIDVHQDENQAAGSEEETEQETEHEQEDDMILVPQVPQSQEILHSSEEDKENFNGPSNHPVGTDSAHDRLSQALAMESGPSSRVEGASVDVARTTQSNSIEVYDEDQYFGRSSQVMVKDSQQSPQPSPMFNAREATAQPEPSEMELDENANHDVQDEIASPTPANTADQLDQNVTLQEEGQDVEMVENTSSNRLDRPPSGNSQEPSKAENIPHASQTAVGGKPSSMPSHITETPVHLRPATSDMSKLTSIPETSPHNTNNNDWEAQSNGDGANNEDDDLPPMRPTGHLHTTRRTTESQPCVVSSPIKALQSQARAQSQILSSPSGRQRRALTEIASDYSPVTDFKFTDINLDLLTADDEHFGTVVDGSPTRPRKKRRGNFGQTFNTSTAATPPTPHALPPKTTAPIRESPAQQISSAAAPVPMKTVRRSFRPSHREENVYDIEASPQQSIVRRRSIHNKLTGLQSKTARQSKVQTQRATTPVGPKVDTNSAQQASSRPSTTLDVESTDTELPFSDSNTVKSPPTTPRPPAVASEAVSETASEKVEIAPSQVLAVWKGQPRAYYPATCLGTPLGVSQANYSVRFEDCPPLEVVKGAVKRLELRVGDGVKVNLKAVPRITYIIRGFEDKYTKEDFARAAENNFFPLTDVYGHASVILGPKQRKSLPNGGLNNSENVIKVPIARIYLDTTLWNKLKDRAFTYQPEETPQAPASHAPTPSEKSSLPASPSIRFSRSMPTSTGVFANMAFAVSYKDDESSKNRISKLITDNGGSILHDGFTELFEPSSIHPADTPTRGNDKDTGSSGLRLTSLADNVGFACLIADTHSRREKYMQALALGLPCLAGRWVEDCVAKGHVIDWDVYLLPAGDSTYLNGATKSRMMIPTPPSEARLPETIATRPKLLAGKSVLIVTGRGKAEEKRKAYIFLTFALGAARVERIPDLETARALIESQAEASMPCKWDLVYVDDADHASAKSMLGSQPRTTKVTLIHGKKRKKSAAWNISHPTDGSTPIARVVGNEFVCQSLILGRLLEE